jgi:uncharacterized protein YbjT (DUF2867 family)
VKILIAGASGFIGKALMDSLLLDPGTEIVALSRKVRASSHPRVTWRHCDLFSMKELQEAMEGCERAYYLVHSMLPTAALDQGSFYDFDLILADNFARCARRLGLKQIIYLGGMIPETGELSWHLRSRLEVETVLRDSGIPCTVLRAGLIIGKGGSSFDILRKLVERLPWMVCPAWTRTVSQPIALEEVVEVLVQCLRDPSGKNRVFDLGGPEVLTYQQLLQATARALGVSRRLYSFNLIPLGLSRLWVSLITGSPRDLVYPLVLSLKHPMVAQAEQAWSHWSRERIRVSQALDQALREKDRASLITGPLAFRSPVRVVRSVQRIHLPEGWSALRVAREYFEWLPRFLFFVIRISVSGTECRFFLISKKILLLHLERSEERSSSDRQLLYVRGGLLAARGASRGRLEFREALGGRVILAALHDFVPALPWVMYRFTQALVHVWVMKAFDLHLQSLDSSKN